eukprot:4746472-Pleurochrysis_carterae.AAC.1
MHTNTLAHANARASACAHAAKRARTHARADAPRPRTKEQEGERSARTVIARGPLFSRGERTVDTFTRSPDRRLLGSRRSVTCSRTLSRQCCKLYIRKPMRCSETFCWEHRRDSPRRLSRSC